MVLYRFAPLFAVVVSLLIFGCQRGDNSAVAAESDSVDTLAVAQGKSMRAATFDHFRLAYADMEEGHAWADQQYFVIKNRDEILGTLEVVDTMAVDQFGLSLVRYSLGPDVYRSAIWLRKIDDTWLSMYSEFGDDYTRLDPESQEQLNAMVEKADLWLKESKFAWWRF